MLLVYSCSNWFSIPEKKAPIILIPLFVFLAISVSVGLALFVLPGNPAQEWYIKREIAKANYCEAASDCQLAATAKCPFDCYVYVNKKEAERIGNMIENYESRCAYQCIEFKGKIECVNNICQQECIGSQCKERN